MRDDLRQLLPSLAVFRGLVDHEIEKVCSLIATREFAANEVIANQGDLATSMFIIGRGRCQITLAPEGDDHPIILAELGVGDSIGEMALVDIQPRSATITALEPSLLFGLSNMDFLTIYEWNIPTYALMLNNICREISRRLRKANQRICALTESANDESPLS
jgi:CRP/FNR family cyclic AMP-dependent transcriptional regulator